MEFKNVPELLADSVRDAFSRVPPKSLAEAYLLSAADVVGFYLGRGAIRDFVLPALSDGNRKREMIQVHLAADTLFSLRAEPGFDEFCRRLRGRDIRSTLFELRAAKIFLDSGYRINTRPETGIKGQDYDFSAERDGESINVEVTALTAEKYSRSGVLNVLKNKRKQLPKDNPAVIFCIFLDQWEDKGVDWRFRRISLAFDFLRQTNRINAVVFMSELYFQNGKNYGMVSINNTYFNASPRIHLRNPQILRRIDTWPPSTDFNTLVERHKPDFFRWVDGVLPKKLSG